MRTETLILLVLLVSSAAPAAESPYAGEEQRPIKSLAAGEISSLRAGQGMGFAKLAELNSYPGPKHVLELATELELTTTQLEQTEALFEEMQLEAIALGTELIAAEAALDLAFEEGEIDATSLERALLAIGEVRARLRFTHLEAHLRQKALLTDAQVAKYDSLRGYGMREGSHDGHSHHHHPGKQPGQR